MQFDSIRRCGSCLVFLVLVSLSSTGSAWAQSFGGYPDPISNPASGLMLDLPVTGDDPTAINFAALPRVSGSHTVVTQGDAAWQFRLHNYLTYHDNKYWMMWSHGPTIEDKPTQHVRYMTSTDGATWSGEGQIVGPSSQAGFRHIARGFWKRDGELYALASHDEAGGYFGANLELRGYKWNGATSQWDASGVIVDDTINNFEPVQISNGQWVMSRRGNNYASDPTDRSWLIGGVDSISDWTNVPIPATTARLEEPLLYELDDNHLVALYRDNSGSRRIYRSFSNDQGQSWTQPVQTNFPDATSKFFSLETSKGQHLLISNANPGGRNPLTLAVSQDGLVYRHMGVLDIPGTGSFQYPHAIEQDGNLYIAFSRNKTSIETFRVSLDEIDKLLTSVPETNPNLLLNGDFEDQGGPFPNRWHTVRGAPKPHGGLGDTSTAVLLRKQSQGGDRIRQDLLTVPGPSWELDLLFATEDPGGASDRGLNIIINNTQDNGILNLRVNGDGSVQTASSGPTQWHTIEGLENVVQFSVDADGNGSFEDVGDSLHVHRLTIRADYASATPSYTVSISDAGELAIAHSGQSTIWYGPSPPPGSSIRIVDFSAQNSGGSFLVDQVSLQVPTKVGDFNGDGSVDGADFVIWQTNFPTATGATLASGDANGDGAVDGADFVIWQTNFPSAAHSQPVPEPSSLWIGAAGLALLGVHPKTCMVRSCSRDAETSNSVELQPMKAAP